MKPISSATAVDLMRRVSNVSEVPPASQPSYYHEQTTSFPVLELKPREQPAIRVRDKRWAGLYVHSIAMGFVSTVLPLTVYPFLTGYLNMEGTQTLSARALLALPWVLRPLLRMVAASASASKTSRYKRCLGLGWLLASIALTIASVVKIDEPFFPRTKLLEPRPRSQLNATELSLVNLDAPGHGALHVALLAAATIGLLLADVGADALIEQTANEYFPPLGESADSAFTRDLATKRIAGMLAAFVFMGLTLNGADYGGDFGFSLGYSRVLTIVSLISIPPGPCSHFLITERSPDRSSFSSFVQQVWMVFQNRGLNFLIACRLAAGVLRGVSATPAQPIALYWAYVQPINDNVLSFVAVVTAVGCVRFAGKKGWVFNHVKLLLLANVVVLALDCLITMATIWDVVRSKYLWIGMPLLQAVPSALKYLIVYVVVDEIAESGTAELTRELVLAVAVLASSLGGVLAKFVGATFDVTNDDILTDSHDVRSHVTIVFLVAYAAQLLSLAWVFALPRRGDAIREWKAQYASPSPLLGAILVMVLALGLWLSVTAHVLSVNASTACYWFAGGSGC